MDSTAWFHLLSHAGNIIVGHHGSIQSIQPSPWCPSGMARFAQVLHIHPEIFDNYKETYFPAIHSLLTGC